MKLRALVTVNFCKASKGVSSVAIDFAFSETELIWLTMYFKVFVSVVLFSLIQSVAINCKYEAADGIHFDLSPLMNNEKDYYNEWK